MTSLPTLGLPTAKQPYAAGLALAPVPKHPTMRKPMLVRDYSTPLTTSDPAKAQRGGAVIAGFAAALVQLDHFARQAQGLGVMQHQAKNLLNRFVGMADEVLATMQKTFDNRDGDAVNALSEVLGQSAELMLQLTPPQIHAALTHQHNMATANIHYVPPTVGPEAILPAAHHPAA